MAQGPSKRIWWPLSRVQVQGDSMLPVLRPGDRLLVWRTRKLRLGDIVVAPDPRAAARTLVKRVAALEHGAATLRGDNPEASTDSRVFGAVPVHTIRGRAVYRYAPADRAGRL